MCGMQLSGAGKKRRLVREEEAMRIPKSILAVAGFVALGLAMAIPGARAGEGDQLTKFEFTFTKPVEVPGTVLPPGTYWFVIQDAQNAQNDEEKNIIQIRNADNTDTVATVPARPIQRKSQGYGTASPSASMDGVEMSLAQSNGGHPEAILTWFYPSGFTGHQFVYSDNEQKRLDEEPNVKVVLKAQKGSDGNYSASLDQ
jgi:hypothetical protein